MRVAGAIWTDGRSAHRWFAPGDVFGDTAAVAYRFNLREPPAALGGLGAEWDALAEQGGSPYHLRDWLEPFCEVFSIEPVVGELRGDDGALQAAVVLRRAPGGFAAVANDHTGDWGVLARDPGAHDELWGALGALRPRRMQLRGLREGDAAGARRGLERAGLQVFETVDVESPFLALPETFDALLASRSSNLRSQLGRRRRNLEREGTVVFRTVDGGPDLDRDLDAVFAVEGSGWKAREGTAIVSDPRTERLYRTFAHRLAAGGRLRLYLLEVDGRVLAGDLGCVVGDVGFLIKTGFEESAGNLSPGLVLRAEVLRASIEEGLRGYDFLGPADQYKLRWTDDRVRARMRLEATRGAATVWRRSLRPALARVRRRIRS